MREEREERPRDSEPRGKEPERQERPELDFRDSEFFGVSEKSKVLRHFQHFPASAGASTRPFRVADFVDFPWDPHDFRKDFKGFARPELARMRILKGPQRNLKDF